MQRLTALALSACLLLALAGCGGGEDAAPGWTAMELALETASDDTLAAFAPGSEEYSAIVGGSYGLDEDAVIDGAVLAAAGASAKECAVLRFPDEEAAADAAALLRDYLAARYADFTGYMPEEAAMIESARVETRGAYCVMTVLPDADGAIARFEACFGAPPPTDGDVDVNTPPPAASAEPSAGDGGWEYDAERIKAAYFSGDESGLAAEDLAILSAAREILALAPDTLSEYERELIIHDAIVDAAQYDEAVLSAWPLRLRQPEPNNENPYGALVKGLAVCRGYASSFQLLMDLAGIECITVEGTANHDREPHAWNMVRLDGEWYCVDVTWDDPVGSTTSRGYMAHLYFNVTSEFMRDTNHYWDAEGVPEASSTRWAWQG